MKIQSEKGYSPICESVLAMKNRSVARVADRPQNLLCRPCITPTNGLEGTCCCNCYTLHWPGMSDGDIVSSSASGYAPCFANTQHCHVDTVFASEQDFDLSYVYSACMGFATGAGDDGTPYWLGAGRPAGTDLNDNPLKIFDYRSCIWATAVNDRAVTCPDGLVTCPDETTPWHENYALPGRSIVRPAFLLGYLAPQYTTQHVTPSIATVLVGLYAYDCDVYPRHLILKAAYMSNDWNCTGGTFDLKTDYAFQVTADDYCSFTFPDSFTVDGSVCSSSSSSS